MDLATFRQRLGQRVGYDGNTGRLDGFINDAIQHFHGWRPDWSWARRTVQFQTRTPETGTTATVTAASRTVSGLSVGTVTRTGARLSLPDGIVYDINVTAPTSTAFLTTPYTGPSLVALAPWTLYYDTWPLPPDCSEIERLIATGNGWEYHLPQQSLTPQHMKRLTIRDNESWPSFYALESANPIPAPWIAPTVADSGAGALPDGVYQYWYAFRNTATGETGPLSQAATITHTGGGSQTDITGLQLLNDYSHRVYRSVAGGSDPMFLGDIAGLSVLNEEALDSTLGINAATQEYIGAHPGHGHTQKVRLWPPPDSEYVVTLSYFATQPELRKVNDVPMLPMRHHQAVLDYAQALYLREQDQHGAAGRIEQRCLALLEEMSTEQNADPAMVVQIGRGMSDSTAMLLEHGGRWPRHVG